MAGSKLLNFYLVFLGLYFAFALIASMDKELRLVPLVFAGIFLTHLTYGVGFLKGLLHGGLEQ